MGKKYPTHMRIITYDFQSPWGGTVWMPALIGKDGVQPSEYYPDGVCFKSQALAITAGREHWWQELGIFPSPFAGLRIE